MNNNLLILGAGQYGIVAKEIAEEMGTFGKIDFLDDSNEVAIGKVSDYERFVIDYSYAVVAIGNPELRLSLIEMLEEVCYRIAILVSPRSYVSKSAQIMKGTIIEPMAVVQTGSTVCIGNIISSGAVLRHNCFVGDCCHIDCNAVVCSNTIMLAKTKVECGQVYKNK